MKHTCTLAPQGTNVHALFLIVRFYRASKMERDTGG